MISKLGFKMRLNTYIFIIIVYLVLSGPAQAQLERSSDKLMQNITFVENIKFELNFQSVEKSSSKSGVVSAFLSALIPGLGQIYTGNYYKAAGFLAVEAGLIGGRKVYNDKGSDIENDFIEYADNYWNVNEYLAWLDSQPGGTTYAHSLPHTKNQQYYEMIGKYNQFLEGWPDTTVEPRESEMRLHYMRMQHESNTNYKRAETLANIMVLNRLVSAIDAAINVKRKDSKYNAGLSYCLNPVNLEIIPMLKFEIKGR